MHKTMITLLLVDDDPLLRQELRRWLERAADITVVGKASPGDEAMACQQKERR
jgi:DNA-binding NarL/FixJ family response regulator